MKTVSIVIGDVIRNLQPWLTGDKCAHGFQCVVGRNDSTGAYVVAELHPVHRHGCPETLNGLKAGDCNCGAFAIFDELVGMDVPRPHRKPWRTARR